LKSKGWFSCDILKYKCCCCPKNEVRGCCGAFQSALNLLFYGFCAYLCLFITMYHCVDNYLVHLSESAAEYYASYWYVYCFVPLIYLFIFYFSWQSHKNLNEYQQEELSFVLSLNAVQTVPSILITCYYMLETSQTGMFPLGNIAISFTLPLLWLLKIWFNPVCNAILVSIAPLLFISTLSIIMTYAMDWFFITCNADFEECFPFLSYLTDWLSSLF